MLVVGGLCGLLVGGINQLPAFYRAPIAVQSILGAALVLAVEFASGCILNLWLGLAVWDYSDQPGNILGQICPAFGLVWLLLMPFAIWADDTMRWMLWFYDSAVNASKTPPPTCKIYTLKSIYRDFLKGR